MLRYWKDIPPLKSLLALEAVARHASFSQAAEELNVSQSAISHAVNTAESFLGAVLVDRTTRPVSLTADGRTYIATLASCLTQLATQGRALRPVKPRNTLTISCNLAYGNYWLMPRLKSFHETWPDLQVNLVTTYQGLASLDDGIDIAVRFGDGNWPGCISHLLLRERILPVATPDYIARHGKVREPCDLLVHNLLHAVSVEWSWYDWTQWFEHFGIQSPALPGPSFDNHLLMMQAALAGRGVALGWVGTASDFLQHGQLVKVLDQPVILPTGLYAVTRAGRDPHVAPFIEWITAMATAEAEGITCPFL